MNHKDHLPGYQATYNLEYVTQDHFGQLVGGSISVLGYMLPDHLIRDDDGFYSIIARTESPHHTRHDV